MAMTTDRACVEAARQGDHGAFAQLVERYQRPVYSLASRMLGNSRDAEDAAQEVFLKAYRSLRAYDPSRPFSTWLLAVAAHHCIDRLRRRRIQAVSLDVLPPWRWVPVETVDPQRAAEDADEADRVAGLLAGLPTDYRLVLILRYWHDLGYAEIAEVLGDSESAVKSRLHRARRQMATLIASDNGHATGRAAGDGRRATPTATAKGERSPCAAMMPAS